MSSTSGSFDGAPASAGSAPRASRAKSSRTTRKLLPLIGAAFGAGVALAKVLDWRGHAHPRI